jgi:hypothetical protein
MNQVQGMKSYLASYNPVYITDKKQYISIIRSECETKSVVYIPSLFINWPVINKKWFAGLFAQYQIPVEEQTLGNLRRTLNESRARVFVIQLIFGVLSGLNPLKFMMVFNDLTFTGRTFAHLLKKTSCKSVYVMHGLLSDELIGSLHISDYYFIFGEYTRPVLTDHGIQNHQIFTTGTPYLEYYRKEKKSFPLKNHIQTEDSAGKKTILILLSGFGHTTSKTHHEAILKALASLIRANKEKYHFVFKLHRKDRKEYYQIITGDTTLAKAYEIFSFDHFKEKETIFDWIDLCDTIITGASTTAVEAMYLKKPVITVDLMQEYEYETLHIRNGATYHTRTEEELMQAFLEVTHPDFVVKPEALTTAKEFFSSPEIFEEFFSTSIKTLFPQ